ncbi:hypothetical protein RU820_06155 [Acidithiobacillus ferrooxidans]|uniref:VWA domain-containing protein n=1 Tax=Acidithiobacillus ferrooxidans (strain ATCC 23270 / DSM 14882 / CIP 104768 / NCIMB 8455) TaxID=243159 RepID=B7J8X4_ACIF2|nr:MULTISPECIES: hypothetical protein [Acidithiobacillus]ACK78755.1 conserved hypothetical protein [Acidithiobacillus ferrooxidans ATCC 23270]
MSTMMKGLRIAAAALGRRLGVTVSVDPFASTAYTDGKRVVLPVLPMAGPQEQEDLFLGLVAHEAFHIRHTFLKGAYDGTPPDGVNRTPFIKGLQNSLEDARIENLGGKQYRGAPKLLANLIDYGIRAEWFPDAPKDDTTPGTLATFAVLYRYRAHFLGQHTLDTAATNWEAAARQAFSSDLWDRVLVIADKAVIAKTCHGPEGPWIAAQAISDLLQEAADQSQPEQSQDQGGDQGQGNSQDKGQSEDDSNPGDGSDQDQSDGQGGGQDEQDQSDGQGDSQGQNGEGQGEGHGNGSDKDQGQGNSQGQNESQGDGNGQNEGQGQDQGQGDSQGQSDGDQRDGSNAQPSGPGKGCNLTPDQAENCRQAVASGEDDIDKSDIADMAEQVLQKIAAGHQNENITESEPRHRVSDAFKVKTSADMLYRQIAGPLEAKLWAQAQEEVFTSRTGTSGIVPTALHRHATTGQVFARRLEGDTRTMAVKVLLDLSGSMGDTKTLGAPAHAVSAAAMALSKLFSSLGIEYSISWFGSTYSKGRDFSSAPLRQNEKWELSCLSGTCLAQAMNLAGSDLVYCDQERRILIVLTDGDADVVATQATDKALLNDGVDVRYVLLGDAGLAITQFAGDRAGQAPANQAGKALIDAFRLSV